MRPFMRPWTAPRAFAKWDRAGRPVPAPPIIKQTIVDEYRRRFGLRLFVETGTFQGEMIQAKFQPESRHGQWAAQASRLTKRYGNRTLFHDLDLHIEYGERVGVRTAILTASRLPVDSRGRGGRGRCRHFTDELGKERQRRMALSEQLRAAIDHGEIQAYFQPLVRVRDMRVVGFETLGRWFHAEFGPIPPPVA